MNKKKILLTTGIGVTAVVAGVAPAVASATNVQSSTLDVDPTTPVEPVDPVDPVEPVEPVDPVDPVEPVEPNLATYPSEDNFNMNNIKVNSSTILTPYSYQTSLNTYLRNLFSTDNFFESNKDLFSNADQYTNVDVSYQDNSADFANKTFKVRITPKKDAVFEGDSTDPKEITVKISNEILIAESSFPGKNTVSYGVKIDGTYMQNDSDLNKYFETEAFKQDFKINNFLNQSVFVKDKGSVFDWNFTNVNIAYVKNSASLKNKTFKVKVTPLQGYAWSRTVTSDPTKINNPVELTIKIANFEEINQERVITLPKSWAIDWVINSRFKYRDYHAMRLIWENLSWFLDMNYEYVWYQNHPDYYKKLSADYQRYIYDGGVADLLKYFPNLEVTGFDNVRWEYMQRVNGGFAFNFYIGVKPKQGFFWADKTTNVKEIKIRFFATTNEDMGPAVIGNSLVPGNIYNFVKDDKAASSELPSKYWVSNALVVVKNSLNADSFAKNRETMYNNIKPDLDVSFPKWNIEVTDIWSASPWGKYDYYAPWTYNIKFTSKENPNITKTIPGYIFTI